MRGQYVSLLLRATLPRSTGWKPSEIPSQNVGQFRFPVRSTLGGAPLFQQWSRIVHASPAEWSGELGENGLTTAVET